MRLQCIIQKGPNKPSLIIANHNTDLDPALVGLGFSRHTYFLASEHALRAGFPSKLLKFFFAPIPFNKARTDVPAIKEMIRRLKAGASVCLFAEGDRSFNGQTGPIALSSAKLAKKSGADLITYRFTGAYFVSPRWAKKKRKGIINGAVVNTYSAQELNSMTAEEILEIMERDLFVDAYERQNEKPCRYPGKDLAESIETVLYLCPLCEAIGTIKSKGDHFKCSCGLTGSYTETGFLAGDSLPFKSITDWDKWQIGVLAKIVSKAGYDPICSDDEQQLFEVQPAVGKKLVGEGSMYIDRMLFSCCGMSFPLENITKFAVVGQKVLLFALKDGATYEVRSRSPRSALKYREIFRLLSGS